MNTVPLPPSRTTGTPLRIGGACAFIGDSITGPRQLVDVPGMRFLVFDYLAEMTMSSFVQARRADPGRGYASDFVEVTLREILPACAQRGIRLVANAGGLDPAGCAEACRRLLGELGLSMRVAHVEGDDCLALMPALARQGVRDFYDGSVMPHIDSANAYLGALPIARALDLGADIVVTGRIVDSATTLGALIHHFGWPADAYDLLAAGSLAGHILECGAQATGGIHTDWHAVPDWEHIGYPVVDFAADGSFTVTKPAGTGGMVSVATVAEQTLYEVGDPAAYLLPDVSCDFSAVRIEADGPDRVRVQGARGRAPSPQYKVSATWQDGYRCTAQVSVFGIDAVAKARRTGEALLARTRELLRGKGHGDYQKAAITVLGAEDSYGPRAQPVALREAVARVAVVHAEAEALVLFSRESRAAGVSWAPGSTMGSALTLNTRPAVEPRYRLFACLVPKSALPPPRVFCDGAPAGTVDIPAGVATTPPSSSAPASTPPLQHAGPWVEVPLIRIAYARCGDKGDSSNIAVFARAAHYLPAIEAALTPEVVQRWLDHLVQGPVLRYAVPTLQALNFVLLRSLDGGGPSSLRPDPLGKGMAQMLLEMPVRIPEDWLR